MHILVSLFCTILFCNSIMKRINTALISLLILLICFGVFSFKTGVDKKYLSEELKYDYAFVYAKYTPIHAELQIEYSNGRVEDFKEMNNLDNASMRQVTKTISKCFNYLNSQNYELRSSSTMQAEPGEYKEYVFIRKASE